MQEGTVYRICQKNRWNLKSRPHQASIVRRFLELVKEIPEKDKVTFWGSKSYILEYTNEERRGWSVLNEDVEYHNKFLKVTVVCTRGRKPFSYLGPQRDNIFYFDRNWAAFSKETLFLYRWIYHHTVLCFLVLKFVMCFATVIID